MTDREKRPGTAFVPRSKDRSGLA